MDYLIYYDQGEDIATYTLLQDSLTDLFYETIISLIPGKVYTFVVKIRNEVGLSLDSVELPILAARIPDQLASLENNPAITTAY